MAKLVTDWVKVAESGKTIDGRVIEASWLDSRQCRREDIDSWIDRCTLDS